MADFNAVVTGAGCGGLSVGAQLAKQVRETLPLGQAAGIAGCCGLKKGAAGHPGLLRGLPSFPLLA